MLRELYFRIKHRPFFRSREGKKRFAAHILSSLIRTAKEELETLKESNRRRLERIAAASEVLEQKNRKLPDLGLSRDQPKQAPYPREEEELIKRRAKFNFRMVAAFALAEAYLNYLSMVIILPDEGLIFESARLVLGFVSTIVAIAVFDKTFVAWQKALQEKGSFVKPALATFFSGLVLLAIYALSSARAADFEGGTGGILYYGFIMLSLALPVMGGWFWADREAILPKYRRIRMWKRTMAEIHEIETRIARWKMENEQNLAREREYFAELTHGYWAAVNFFNVLKDNYNDRNDIKEDVTGTIAESFENFSKEAQRLHTEEELRQGISKAAELQAEPAAGSTGARA